jgi:hypothetical protein
LFCFFCLFFVDYPLQYRRKDAAPGKKGAPKKAGKDMNELKQELDIDDHKIPIEELYQRLGTNPETVKIVSFFILNSIFFSSVVSLFIERSSYPSPRIFRYQMGNGTHTHTRYLFFLVICSTISTSFSLPMNDAVGLPVLPDLLEALSAAPSCSPILVFFFVFFCFFHVDRCEAPCGGIDRLLRRPRLRA